MSKVGLVLGGGGVTGASYELATLLALEMATGWSARNADVIVGTSAGAYVAAIVRGGALTLESITHGAETSDDAADRIRRNVYRRTRPYGLLRWLRHGVLPGLRNPGVTVVLGSPAPYDASGIAEWLTSQIGPAAYSWPAKPTLIVAYDISEQRRVAFGSQEAPDVGLCDAVAASAAVPLLFHPYEIDGHLYVDGGVVSGTHADLVLGSHDPLDLVIILAPMAAEETRDGAAFYENLLDQAGARALKEEIELIEEAWPSVEILVLRPDQTSMSVMRPNLLSSGAAVPSFVRSLHSLRSMLAKPEIWSVLSEHLSGTSAA